MTRRHWKTGIRRHVAADALGKPRERYLRNDEVFTSFNFVRLVEHAIVDGQIIVQRKSVDMQFLCHYGFMNSPKIYASLIPQYGIDVCSEKEKYRDFFLNF